VNNTVLQKTRDVPDPSSIRVPKFDNAMQPPTGNYKDSLFQVRQELTDALKINTPAAVARDLEKSGWPWEWACAAVETIDPSMFRHGMRGFMTP
jgi:hypothetical protein